MKALIYCRVSTDEQAKNGFSLDEQEIQCQKECRRKEFDIVQIYKEHHSAKDFNRPEFQKMLVDIKSKSIEAEILVVAKVDRFSRDVMKTFSMCDQLRGLGVNVYSISNGYLDFNNPNTFFANLMYAGIAQHDNLMRAENTIRGMRQANAEGCWTAKAPRGYDNWRTADGKSSLKPNSMSVLISESFSEFAKGYYKTDELRKKMYERGLKISSKTGFSNLLENITYAGYIVIKSWKGETERIAKGLHEPLISIELFNKVQAIKKNKGRVQAKQNKRNELYPLRGFLECPDCGGNLTASSSTGRNGTKYEYYHCQNSCSVSFKIDEVNGRFVDFLTGLKINPKVGELYLTIMEDVFKSHGEDVQKEIDTIDKRIEIHNNRLKELQDKYLDNLIEQDDYNDMKPRIKSELDDLSTQRIRLTTTDSDFMRYVKFSKHLLTNLDYVYSNSSIEVKQQLIGSIFPEKLIFDGSTYRTTKKNEVLELISSYTWDVKPPQMKQASISASLSTLAPPPGLEPGTY